MQAFKKLMAGWDYHFTGKPAQDYGQTARRATFDQFQTFPMNSIEGRGDLVTQNGVFGGKYWNVVQPPQVIAPPTRVIADLYDGGSRVIGFFSSPLVQNPDSNGIS